MAAADLIRLTAKLTQEPDDVLGYTGKIYVGPDVAEQLPKRDDGSRRYLVTITGLSPWIAALVPSGNGDFFIILNKTRVKTLRKSGVDLDQLQLTLKADESEYGMPMPDELGELMAIDPEGHKYFHQLTPGKMRSLMYVVASSKRESTRLRKAIAIIDYLKAVKGKLDFRELNEFMKAER